MCGTFTKRPSLKSLLSSLLHYTELLVSGRDKAHSMLPVPVNLSQLSVDTEAGRSQLSVARLAVVGGDWRKQSGSLLYS